MEEKKLCCQEVKRERERERKSAREHNNKNF